MYNPTGSYMHSPSPNGMSARQVDVDLNSTRNLVVTPSRQTGNSTSCLKAVLLIVIVVAILAAVILPLVIILTKPRTTTTTKAATCNSTCQNGGTCNGTKCSCIANTWTGSYCQTPFCNVTCQNGGNCSAPQNCSCPSTYTGIYCQTPICNSSCLNNGTCSAPNVCTCSAQWNGTTCAIPVCSPACQNSGNCTAPGVCTCYFGWTGSYCQTVTTVLWTFDNTLNDVAGSFTGTGLNSPTYASGINGYGSALSLTGSSSQCVTVNPYLNMSYISFTWEFWMYPTITPSGDSLFIGQCSQSGTADKCLIFMTRSDIMWFAFLADDVVGSTPINASRWYHMAFVYDLASNQKFIYLDGVLEATHSSVGPLQVSTILLTFGCLTTNGGASFYNFYTGYLDQMLYNSRSKNASEILNDATLVAYYPFLSTAPLIDAGPNYINGSAVGGATVTLSGVVNQAMNFPVNGAYFQMTGLVLLGTSARPFTLALWFQITTFSGGATLAHLSSSVTGGGWCIGFIGLSSNRSIVTVIHTTTANPFITGPQAPMGAWTHVAHTYSAANGMSLYVNGTLITSLSVIYSPSGSADTLSFGNPVAGSGCGSGYPNQQFYGSIDEVKLYSRELSASEVSQLYSNP